MKNVILVSLLVLFVVFPVVASDQVGVKGQSQPQGDRLWITSVSGAAGELVTVDLMIENAITEVDAVTFNLKYDTSKLQYVDWADGTINPGWVMFNINEKSEGEIAIGGFCVKTAIKPGSRGSLATLSFKVKSDNLGDSAYITFDKIRDDVEGFNFENGKIEVKGVIKTK